MKNSYSFEEVILFEITVPLGGLTRESWYYLPDRPRDEVWGLLLPLAKNLWLIFLLIVKKAMSAVIFSCSNRSSKG